MAFVDKMLSDDCDDSEFYITQGDVVSFTGLSKCAASNNLGVCVKSGWLSRVEKMDNNGRDVRYYLKNRELVSFVNKYLRGDDK